MKFAEVEGSQELQALVWQEENVPPCTSQFSLVLLQLAPLRQPEDSEGPPSKEHWKQVSIDASISVTAQTPKPDATLHVIAAVDAIEMATITRGRSFILKGARRSDGVHGATSVFELHFRPYLWMLFENRSPLATEDAAVGWYHALGSQRPLRCRNTAEMSARTPYVLRV